ncbi:MAG: peptide-methionine (S)-S-oxide reductase [Deltaproteobacteria bacterium]|nr:peptide-methionine (S)-S-oxide reductase [Deltaproteobacteria bacterium]
MSAKYETATLGAGCFWCVEAVFRSLKGVASVVSGYAGGTVAYPLYEQVCMGTTGHAEVVQITYDPGEISFGQILAVFWTTHDPTTRNRQGHDSGPQYRSIILYHSEEQRLAAEQSKKEADASGSWDAPIVTEIVPFTAFYHADGRHQEYYLTHPQEAYCQVVIDPKLVKLRKEFQCLVKDELQGDD